jgi:hypothetical protein
MSAELLDYPVLSARISGLAMKVIVVLAKKQLNDPVQIRDRQGIRQPHPPPNRRVNIPQHHL